MKKILVVLLSVLTLTLTACSSELSPQEYTNKLSAIGEEYTNQTLNASLLLYNAILGDTPPDYSAVPGIADKMESCLSEAEKLTPPAKYRDQHNEMCAYIQQERSFIAAFRRIETEGYLEVNGYADRHFNEKCCDLLGTR